MFRILFLYSCLSFLLLQAVPLHASEKSDSLERELLKANTDSLRIQLMNSLSSTFLMQDSAKSFFYGRQALKLAEQSNNAKGKGMAYRNIGICYEMSGNYKTAMEYYFLSLEVYQAASDSIGICEAFNNFGVVYYLQGNYDKALKYYLKAERMLALLNDSLAYSNTLNNIGLIYDKQEQYSKALKYYLLGLSYRENSGNKQKISSSLNNIGIVYQNLKQFDKALSYHEQALAMREQIGDMRGVSASLNNLGDIYLNQGNAEKAKEYFNKSLLIKEKIGDIRGISYSLLGLAQAVQYQRNYPLSISYADRALKIAQDLGLKSQIKEVLETLAEAHMLNGNYKKAYQYLEQTLAYKDSLFNEEKQDALAEMQARFEMDRIELEKENYKKTLAITEADLQRSESVVLNQRIAGVLISTALIILSILFYQLYRSRKQLQQANTQLSKKQKELNELNRLKDKLFSIISHDFRGPLSSIKSIIILLDEGHITQEESKEYLHNANIEISNTLNLLDNLLKWSLNQMKKSTVEKINFDLAELARVNEALLSPIAGKKNIRIVNQVKSPLMVHADQNMMNLVIRNLVSNAVKFSPAHSTIYLDARLEQQQVVVQVKDEGVGIDKTQLASLFQFEHVISTYGTENEKGVGLGLSLCKDFVEQNGGRIWVESETGKGSTFSFSIPVAL